MSAEKDRLQSEMHAALKGAEKIRLAALRLLSAAVKNREVELGHELTTEEFVAVAQRQAKQRRESIEAYESAGRQELADHERAELEVLQTYVPEELSVEAVEAIIDEAIAAAGATGAGDMGAVMREVMARTKGRADGKAVSESVRAKLAANAG